MDNYGMNMLGTLTIEKVTTRPTWSIQDTGRFIFDLSTKTYFLGGPSLDVGYDGWVALGLTNGIVKAFNIDWDTNLTGLFGRVSAKHVPALLDGGANDVQSIIDEFSTQLLALSSAAGLAPNSIKDFHLDIAGTNKISADSIPVLNLDGHFSGGTPTIESALKQIVEKTTGDIYLDTVNGHFGARLNLINLQTCQDALESLEEFISKFNATQIPCTYEGSGSNTNVQFAIDALYHMHTSIKLIDLEDVPSYDPNKLYLKSNGLDRVDWVELIGNDIACQYPGTQPSNVQGALWHIGIELDSINNRLNNFSVIAEEVEYTHAAYPTQFLNVDDALDYMFANFYSPTNQQSAALTPCSGIGSTSNNNVQLGLTYLLNQIIAIQSQLPCSVGAAEVGYASANGATDVAHTLDYIMGFIYQMITVNGISYPQFSV